MKKSNEWMTTGFDLINLNGRTVEELKEFAEYLHAPFHLGECYPEGFNPEDYDYAFDIPCGEFVFEGYVDRETGIAFDCELVED